MRGFFFQRLAISGMKKNKQLYVPYLFTCVGMVMMFCILQSLSYSPLLQNMKGGTNVEMCLSLGKFVIAVFAVLFLLYTNSFLTRRRYKEFGLYHVLGMGKRGLRKIMFWESLFVTGIGLGGGLFFGATLSKLAELVLANILKVKADYSLHLEAEAFLITLEIFVGIFALLMVKSMITVQRTKPLELFHSDNLGEKPPKTNWLLAALGVLLLAGAYYLALSIKTPLAALVVFFVAVLMVIVATYFLFMAGSVALCKLLKNNKGYYYRKNHFVSVSSMVYRMKRNGAGLASICILCTMVLVMVSSTSSLYFCVQDAVRGRYVRDTEIAIRISDFGALAGERQGIIEYEFGKVFAKHGCSPQNVLRYTYADTTGILRGTELVTDPEEGGDVASLVLMDRLWEVNLIPLADYNRIMGTDLKLEAGTALLYLTDGTYREKVLSICGVSWEIAGRLEEMFPLENTMASVVPNMVLVVPDIERVAPLIVAEGDRFPQVSLSWCYGYDLDVSDEESIEVFWEVIASFTKGENLSFLRNQNGSYHYSASCVAQELSSILGLYGGLFFLGIMLSILFVFAAVLIIYYKQISEGYEDQGRFEIMQKVGMTKRDIKKSINSQVLTVFFSPLLMAGVHLAFAYPMIWKILKLLYLPSLKVLIMTTLADYVVFGIFYVIVYKWTAGAYYGIVSASKE